MSAFQDYLLGAAGREWGTRLRMVSNERDRERLLRFADAWVAIGYAATVVNSIDWTDHSNPTEAMQSNMLNLNYFVSTGQRWIP